MNSTHPRGGNSPRQVQIFAKRLLIGLAGTALALGLGACGSGTGHENPPPTASPAESQAAPAEEPTGTPPAATQDEAASAVAAQGSPVQAQPRGIGAKAHLVLTGSYKVDGDAMSNCALFPNKTFQVGINVPAAPFFVLRLENFHGAGEYEADARVRANYSGETVRQSRGIAKTTITVKPLASGGGEEISGSFSGSYKGDGGAGTVSGSFERCVYELKESNG